MSVCLAISSYRNDTQALALAEAASAEPSVDEILIVDSQGTGRVPRLLRDRGLEERVHYFNQETNVGSAGNFAIRLQLAAERGHDWVYAVNHDGEFAATVLRALVARANATPSLGAIYPLRFKVERAQYDLTGLQRLPLPFRGSRTRPQGTTLRTYWGSSNGALYATAPIRAGLRPWGDLWMGWEDLGYGWLLHRHGYDQLVLTTVEARDDYEYARHEWLGRSFTIARKPSWGVYYQVRNLILVTRRNDQPIGHWLTVAGRIGLEAALSATLRPDRRKRLGLIGRGVIDGLRNRSGKIEVP